MGRGGEGTVKANNAQDDLVPVTLLCGFLGSGKTTLLKHILETQHDDKNFRAAVIVNDMAELNIDEKLIDKKSLIQSDEAMIGMQNGCICCTLQSDLVEQLIGLTQMKNEDEKMKFNYILIEASGVSEPHEIAPLFEIEDHEACGIDDAPDHDHDHDQLQLGQVARLDTCVTLIDSAEFYNNLGSMTTYEDQSKMVGTIPELMMDQVEFANVIILNKGDLVNDKQKADLDEKIALLNPQAKVIKTTQAKVNVMDLLHTKLYKDKESFVVTSTKSMEYMENERKRLEAMGMRVPEACTARFDIKSFVYRARKPFHPGRLEELFLEPYFMDPEPCLDPAMEGIEIDPLSIDPEEYKTEEEKKKEFEEIQHLAIGKQKKRIEVMGELLRSKGFFWNAPTHDVIGEWQQAGNVLRLDAPSPWMCVIPDFWQETRFEPAVKRDMTNPDTNKMYEYGDRRQEIVFIGHKMNEMAIQEILDKCLLTDEEFAMGPKMWKETMEELDTIQLQLPDMTVFDDEDENMTVLGDDGKKHASEECRIACEEARNKKAMGDSGLKYFKAAIDALFKNWTALEMLVRDGAGGPQSRDKAEWMTGATENWFYENKDLDVYEVSVFLDEILINEFNVSVDDGSLEDVASSICEFYRLCQISDEETLMAKLKSLPKYDLANVQVQEITGDYVDKSGPSNYLQKLDLLEPKKEPKVPKEKIAPVIDEDGFETVVRRKRR